MNREEQKIVEDAFIEGFRGASDKLAFLRLARVPLELADGGKLVVVRLEERFEVGSVSPGFGSRELVYHPLPKNMAKNRAELRLIYQSLGEMRSLTLAQVLPAPPSMGEVADAASGPDHSHDHVHDHGHAHAHGHGHDHVHADEVNGGHRVPRG